MQSVTDHKSRNFRLTMLGAMVASMLACGVENKNDSLTENQSETNAIDVHFGKVLMGGEIVETSYFYNEEGYAIADGDIIVEPLRDGMAGQKTDALATRTNYLWPVSGGYVQVPYVVSASLSAEAKKAVNIAIDRWKVAMNINFVARSTQADYISFEPGSGCSSALGKVGGKQVIQLAAACFSTGAVHELGHALGAFHEHTRTDRDNYVTINSANVQSGKIHNFNKYNLTYTGTDNGTYDFRSIMHYDSYSFSTDTTGTTKPTILQKSNGKAISRSIALSSNDICYMKKRYFPGTSCSGSSTCTASVTGNETSSTAIDISPYNGILASVQLCRSDIAVTDKDWFKVYLPAGKTISINGQIDAAAAAIFEGSTQIVNGAVYDWQLTDGAYTYKTTKAGWVYITVQGADQLYKLKVSW